MASAGATIVLAVTTDWRLVVPTLFVFGAFLFVTFPALFSTVTELTAEDERGTAFGILFGFQLGGGAASVYICGILADYLHSPAYSFLYAGLLAVISLVTISYWNMHARGTPKNSGH